MVPTDKPSPTSATQWAGSYTQSDVDTIREQIEQNESAKRRWLVLALLITAGGLIATIILASTGYALYSSSSADRERLRQENAALGSRSEQCQKQVEVFTAREAKATQAREEAQSRLDKLRTAVLSAGASGVDTANFARMIYDLPNSRIEVTEKPPDKLFRNWKITSGATTEVYTLVGGFVDGKWVIHSNLVARR